MNHSKQEIKQKIKYCHVNMTGSDAEKKIKKERLTSKEISCDLGQENSAVNYLSKNRHTA